MENMTTDMTLPDIYREREKKFEEAFGVYLSTRTHTPMRFVMTEFRRNTFLAAIDGVIEMTESMMRPRDAVGDAPGDFAVGSEQRAFGANSVLNTLNLALHKAKEEIISKGK